jgi:hypothetical protein
MRRGAQVLVRRGGREERSREVRVPLSSAVAAALAERAASEAAERAHINRLTLQVAAGRHSRAAACRPRHLQHAMGSHE